MKALHTTFAYCASYVTRATAEYLLSFNPAYRDLVFSADRTRYVVSAAVFYPAYGCSAAAVDGALEKL